MVGKALIPAEMIEKRILLIRGEKVMLDADLAELYGVEVKHLKRQVRRNIDRFPEDFMIELSKEEYESLRRHSGTLKKRRAFQILALCLYRTRGCNVFQYFEQ